MISKISVIFLLIAFIGFTNGALKKPSKAPISKKPSKAPISKKPSKAPIGKPSIKPTIAPTKSNKIVTKSDNVPLPYNNFVAIAGTDGMYLFRYFYTTSSRQLIELF